uniref:helix-turn-helix domain-containing protein n=1 Tax=Gemmiger formicilis TaxID=745368 RepID=UPI004027431C
MMLISKERLFLSMARMCCSMKKLSALSGVSIQTLRNIKAGKTIFPETAGKIARALGVDVADLLESKGE